MTDDIPTRVVSQRQDPRTGRWSTQRDVTDDLERLRATLDRLVDPHAGAAIDPQGADIERARTLIGMVLGPGGEA